MRKPVPTPSLSLLALLAVGACAPAWQRDDQDGDGYTSDDCLDAPAGVDPTGLGADAASVHPGASETWYDGIDQDCGQDDDFDADGDGWVLAGMGGQATWGVEGSGQLPEGDCDDAEPSVNPDQAETWYDGVDQDCDGNDDDQDLDGWGLEQDCDDVDPDANPDQVEAWYDGVDQDCDGNDDDQDGDGSPIATDCDDQDPLVHPGATETCTTAADDDCDGSIDDGTDTLAWHPDVDGDGWGDRESTLVTCADPGGWVLDGTDCDDGDPAVRPDAPESCLTPVDDDCDGVANEDDAADAPTWYSDADLDGAGDPATGTLSCLPAPGQVSDASDCDDENALARPGLDERCATLFDDDCDGATNEDDAVDASTWYPDADGDGWGGTPSTVACEAPDGFVASLGDCDDTNSLARPDGVELCSTSFDDDCDGLRNDATASDAATWYADTDGDGWGGDSSLVSCEAPDGWVSPTGDCQDLDDAIHPAATERCDDVDNDCDGETDDDDPGVTGRPTWYRDADGDGSGAASSGTLEQCLAPDGYTDGDTDCDDANPGFHPGATEQCDEADRDEDCDGLADDADPDATGQTPWYPDADGDGTGNPLSPADACDAPAGHGTDATDCDDTDSAIHPGAEETCDAGLTDEDCDGLADDDDPGVTGTFTWYRDADSDGHGSSLSQQACLPPSGWVSASTDCDDTDSAIHPGSTEVCDDLDTDEDCDGKADNDDTATGTTAFYYDADGDGDAASDAPSHSLCDADTPYVATTRTDCDDGDPARSGLDPESDDDVDNDCDDLVDEGFRKAGDLVISEIHYNPYGGTGTDPNNSYIEITNPHPTRALYLDGLQVYSATGSSGYTFYIGPGELVAPPQGTVLLCSRPTFTALETACDYRWANDEHGTSKAGPTYYTSMWLSHADGPLRISLGGVVIDEVDYDLGTSPWPNNNDGKAMELSTSEMSATANDLGGSWCTATSAITGSPGDFGTPNAPNSCE